MIPIKLALRNFMCYRDNVPPLLFDGIHVACLCGDNGNGKSALLDAMTWALWGEARAKSDDELIHLGQAEMEVEFEFAVAGDRYRVIRKRTKPRPGRAGQTLLELQVATGEGFTSITGNSLRETQQKITGILRMDYQTFINSAFLVQGRADEFTIKPPAKRKEVLSDILRLSFYDELQEQAKSRAKEKEGDIGSLKNAIADIDRELSRKGSYQEELEMVQEAVAKVEAQVRQQEVTLNALRDSRRSRETKEQQYGEICRRIEQIERQLFDLERQVDERRSRIERYEMALASYPQEYSRVEARLSELATLERVLDEKGQRAEHLLIKIHHLRQTNVQLQEEMKELKGKLDLLAREEARCPLCQSELSLESRKMIMATYEGQGRGKANAYQMNEQEVKQKQRELDTLRREMSELEKTKDRGRAWCERRTETLEKEKGEATLFLPQEKEALNRAQEALTRWRDNLQADVQKRSALLTELEALPQVEQKLDLAEKSYQELKHQEQSHRDKIAELRVNLRRCADAERGKVEKTRELRKASEGKAIYDDLALAFGKKGIQALIIESALPQIEEEANRLLARMTDNRMHLTIETRRAYKTKKGEEETLDINISDELGTRSYEMFSGGEAFRINFALRIALSKLLARRVGAPLPTLIIDEGFGTQDSNGREKIVEAINSIQDDFEKIIVITHIEEFKEVFPASIEVTKTAGGSMFTLS